MLLALFQYALTVCVHFTIIIHVFLIIQLWVWVFHSAV